MALRKGWIDGIDNDNDLNFRSNVENVLKTKQGDKKITS
jgi:hypothetical protein